MSQTNVLTFSATNQNPNGAGSASGFVVTLPSSLSYYSSNSANWGSWLNQPISGSATIAAGITGTLAATAGSYDIAYPISVDAQYPAAVSDGEIVTIDTSQFLAGGTLALTGPAVTTNIAAGLTAAASVAFGAFGTASAGFQGGVTLGPQLSISDGLGTISFSSPSPFSASANTVAEADALPPLTVSGVDQPPVFSANLDLAAVIAAAVGVPPGTLSGTLHIGAVPIPYNLVSENLEGDLSISQSLTFVPTGVEVTMSDGTDTEVGSLGQTFSFSAPASGSGTLDIAASYALTGILFDTYGAAGSMQFNVQALSVSLPSLNLSGLNLNLLGSGTLGPLLKYTSPTLNLGTIELPSINSAITVGNTQAAIYTVAYGPTAGDNESGSVDESVSSVPIYDSSTGQTTTYAATADLAGSDLTFDPERTSDAIPETLSVPVTYGGGDLDPAAMDDLVVSGASTSPPGFEVTRYAYGLGPDDPSGTLVVQADNSNPGSYNEALPIEIVYDGGTVVSDITAKQDVYASAAAAFSYNGNQVPYYDPTLNLGVVHVGDPLTITLDVTNTATGSLTDVLDSSVNTSGVFATLNGLAGLAAGNSGPIEVAIDTSQAGGFTSTPSLFGLTSHDPELDDIAAAGGINVDVTVSNLAQPGIVLDSAGPYALTNDGNDWTLDFGILNVAGGSGFIDAEVAVTNSAPAGVSDYLDEIASVTGSGFSGGVFDPNIYDLEASGSFPLGGFVPELTQIGTHTETVVLDAESINSSSTTVLQAQTLTVEDVVTDAAPNIIRGTALVAGGTFAASGTLLNTGEHDWFAVSLVANQAYEVTVNGLSSEAEVTVQDAAGTDGAAGEPASLAGVFSQSNNDTYFMPSSSGTYYIDIADPTATTPESYTVNVGAVTADYTDNPSHPGTVAVGGQATGTLANVGQHDWFAVSLVANQAYEVTVNGLSSEAEVTVQDAAGTDGAAGEPASLAGVFSQSNNDTYFMPSSSGTYYIDIADPTATTPESYTVNVGAVTADYTDNPSHPGTVAVGGQATGTLANVGQHDWFAVSLVANQAYEVTVNGLSSEAEVTVQDADGTDGAAGEPASLAGVFSQSNNDTYFMPSSSGTYYIDIADPTATTPESYTVNVGAVTADYTDNPSHPGTVAVGGQATGTLANVGQHDWFAVSLVANQAYEVTVNGLSSEAEVTVQDADGTDGAAGEPASLAGVFSQSNNDTYFMPSSSGTYYIDIADPTATTPESYTVNVGAVTADVVDNPTTRGVIVVGGGVRLTAVGTSIQPFFGLNVSDASNQTEALFVQASVPSNGVFSNLGGGSYDQVTGEYTVLGSVGSVTQDLQNLSFTPTVGDTTTGQPALTAFQISVIDAGGATAQDNSVAVEAAALCFCAGTLIATPEGEVPVETLTVGVDILTAGGEVRRVVWIGVGKVLATRGQRSAATPVIVRKGALADNVPHHDLHVTKGHALHFDDILVPVEFLVNHRSILWDDRAQEVSLYHIELESHDVLLANGAPAESYRDDGNRWLFQNANSGWNLPAQRPCAPVRTGGAEVDALWRRLLDRCGLRKGLPLTEDPDLHVLSDGVRIDGCIQKDAIYVFNLPKVTSELRVVSRAASPQELGITRDPRCLGIAVRRIVARSGSKFRTLDAADPCLNCGFHEFEPEDRIRWTDGDAIIPSELFSGLSGPMELVLQLGGTATYIDDGSERRAA